MRYLFHNIYGDAADLIATAPLDVICVPFGWDEQTEKNRNDLIASLNLPNISTLPSVVFWCPEKTYPDPFNINVPPRTFSAYWRELPILIIPQPWSWDKIDAAIQKLIST